MKKLLLHTTKLLVIWLVFVNLAVSCNKSKNNIDRTELEPMFILSSVIPFVEIYYKRHKRWPQSVKELGNEEPQIYEIVEEFKINSDDIRISEGEEKVLIVSVVKEGKTYTREVKPPK